MPRIFAMIMLLPLALSGCLINPTMLPGFSADEVSIRSYLFSPYEQVYATANDHCKNHTKLAVPVSQTCADNLCLSSNILFKCAKTE